ncbi:uncharacterized protein LOC144143170 [Haemaphysalis longicornis]
MNRTSDKYLLTTFTEHHGPYGGLPNERLDRDINIEKVLRTPQDLNSWSYIYIKDILTDRTAELRAGDMHSQEKKLVSTGTQQGSMISPLLLNLVIIGVAHRLAKVGVWQTIYADDITIWATGGSESQIEAKMQEAVNAIEDHLNGSGLVCSPSKSELLIIPPQRGNTKNIQR